MPFMSTAFPDLTMQGIEANNGDVVTLDSTTPHWRARTDLGVKIPSRLIDDGFLHATRFGSL